MFFWNTVYDQAYLKSSTIGPHLKSASALHCKMNSNVAYWPTLLARFRNYRCNSQTSHIESNTYGQNQHCQFTSCTQKLMSCFSMGTRSMSSSLLVHTLDLSVVNKMPHDSTDLVVHRTEIWAVYRLQVGRKKVWLFSTPQFNCCICAGAVCRCTVLLEQSPYQLPHTMRIAGSCMTSL